jgi:hypothetical protein
MDSIFHAIPSLLLSGKVVIEKHPVKKLFYERGVAWSFPLEMRYCGKEVKSEDCRKYSSLSEATGVRFQD